MAIIVDENTKLVVQGITGHQGTFHTMKMKEFGTQVVAGVTPGKAGQEVHGVPVFDTLRDAVGSTGANTSAIFVPAPFVLDAGIEAIEEGLSTLVVITEHVPVQDAMRLVSLAKSTGVRMIGPNCPGVGSPGSAKAGILPNQIFMKGDIGVVSRSGTLTYEIVDSITRAGMGQSTCVGIGGDRVIGTTFVDCLRLFEEDDQTAKIVLVGEIGGSAEEEAARFISRHISKPVCSYVAGRSAPPGKRMGHAGAIISRGTGTAESKIRALKEAGVKVAETTAEIPQLLK
ncbi:MAG TPA: succinate--CoA ligase subunit alpha [Euryarchaeota archaeon]|nr:succinate--CoA ligase subunit alpha [Euryarchaeota archaeon]